MLYINSKNGIKPSYKKGDKVIICDKYKATVVRLDNTSKDGKEDFYIVDYAGKCFPPNPAISHHDMKPDKSAKKTPVDVVIADNLKSLKESLDRLYPYDPYSDTHADLTTHCPSCGSMWKETKFVSKVWQDCQKCGKTKEDIMKGISNV